MTNSGLVLLLSAGTLAAFGAALYIVSRHGPHASRGVSLALFAHLAFVTSGLLFVVSLFHVHSFFPLVIHIHTVGEAVLDDFDCDLTLSCVATTAVFVAGIVLAASALLGQVSARALLRECRRRIVPDGATALSGDLLPSGIRLAVVDDPRPDAFSVAVLRGDRRRLLRVEDVIVVTTAFEALLTPAELRAALAHEVAHIRAHDHRYLPFLRSLSRILFLDPVLGYMVRRLSAQYEFCADEDAARATRDPRSLARALFKVAEAGQHQRGAASFRGQGRSPLIVQRIERLLAMAERMELAS